MAYSITEHGTGFPRIDDVRASGAHVVSLLGRVVRAVDPTYGAGEFIYLKGVTSQVVGNLVTYDPTTHQVTLSPDTPNSGKPVAVAMAATTEDEKYGWFQIGGKAVVKKTAVAVSPTVAIYQSATAGRVMPTANSGAQILGAFTANTASVTSTTSTVVVSINRPHIQGQTA